MKVRCINDRLGAPYIKAGATYEAIEHPEYSDRYLINNMDWFKSRFVVVEDVEASIPISKKSTDPNCPCGIFRADCDYHNEN